MTYGAGALNMVNPVAAACAEKSPVVVISGGPGVSEDHTELLLHHQAKRLDSQFQIFREVTCAQTRLRDLRTARQELRRVLAACRHHSRPVYVELPRDLVFTTMPDEDELASDPSFANHDEPLAVEAAVTEVWERMRVANLPVLLVGVEIRRFGLENEVARLARRWGLPVVTTFMGRGLLVDTESPPCGTYLGAAGDPEITSWVENSDALLMLGVIMSDTNLVGQRQRDTDSTPLPGAYLKDATAVGMSPAGTISSFAHHDSFIPGFTGPVMFGTGSASATATATGLTGFSDIADSRLGVSFEVTSTGFYDFDAGVDWTGTTPQYLGFAKVELLNVTAGTTIGAIISEPMSPGVQSLLSSYLPTTDTDYKLVAEVEVSGGFATAGSYGASGSWRVVIVPEPSSFILCCTGLVWLGSIRRRQIRLTCWMSSNYYVSHSRGCDAVKSSKRKSEESPDRSGSEAIRRRC